MSHAQAEADRFWDENEAPGKVERLSPTSQELSDLRGGLPIGNEPNGGLPNMLNTSTPTANEASGVSPGSAFDFALMKQRIAELQQNLIYSLRTIDQRYRDLNTHLTENSTRTTTLVQSEVHSREK